MGDLLDRGAAFLDAQRHQHLSRPVIYRRGTDEKEVQADIVAAGLDKPNYLPYVVGAGALAAIALVAFRSKPATATANRKASKNGQRLSIKTIADAMAHDHIADPLVGSTVKASDVDMFEDRTLRMALREHGLGTAPKNVEKLRMELRKSLARAE